MSHKDLTEKLKQLEEKFEEKFNSIDEALNYLLHKDKIEIEQKNRRRIGFIQDDNKKL